MSSVRQGRSPRHRLTVIAADGRILTMSSSHGQVSLIRSHLADEAARFRRGDYSDPAEIHGMDMPGLAELRSRYDEIDVVYDEIDAGAQLTYTTNDSSLVEAIHAWFDRQSMDHS